jgi:hypothetical protein
VTRARGMRNPCCGPEGRSAGLRFRRADSLILEMGDRAFGVEATTFCVRCGKELAPNANFCHYCGVLASSAPRLTHYSFKAGEAPRIVVSNHCAGSVEVAQNSVEDEVSVDFELRGPDFHDYAAVQSGKLVTVRCRAARGDFWPTLIAAPRANITVKVPPVVERLELGCRFGGVSAAGIRGDVAAETLTGDVRLRDCDGGSIYVRTRAGLLALGNVNGRVSARVSAGSISYSGCLSHGESYFRTGVGNIELALQGDLNLTIEASTMVGEVEVDHSMGAAQFRSEPHAVGHRVSLVVGGGVNRLFAETRTGSISIRGGRKP